MADEEQRLRDIQREYLDFLDDEVISNHFIPSMKIKLSVSNDVFINVICAIYVCRRIKEHTKHWSKI